MGLQEELGLPNTIGHAAHEAAMNVVLTGEMLAKEADRTMRPLGLTGAQFNVLMLLHGQSQEGRLSQTRLGRLLVVNRSNITGLVDRMEAAGWVKRVAAAGDRRVKDVETTAAGRRLVRRAAEVYFKRVAEVFGGLSDSGCRKLCSSLEKVRLCLAESWDHAPIANAQTVDV